MEENTPKNSPIDNLREPWKPGESGNPAGKPAGTRNYATLYKEALRKIAETKDMTPEEVEETLIQSGLMNALKGDFKFYQDVMDRLHGKPAQSIDLKAEITKPLIKLNE